MSTMVESTLPEHFPALTSMATRQAAGTFHILVVAIEQKGILYV